MRSSPPATAVSLFPSSSALSDISSNRSAARKLQSVGHNEQTKENTENNRRLAPHRSMRERMACVLLLVLDAAHLSVCGGEDERS
jgi:hypothetical protein